MRPSGALATVDRSALAATLSNILPVESRRAELVSALEMAEVGTYSGSLRQMRDVSEHTIFCSGGSYCRSRLAYECPHESCLPMFCSVLVVCWPSFLRMW